MLSRPVTGLLLLFACCLPLRAAAPDAATQFEKKIRPLLAEKCWGCHNETKQKGELRLDSLGAMLAGGESGPAVVPGKPEQSLLIAALKHTEQLKMPPKNKLPDADIAALTEWVKAGAVWPDAKPVKPTEMKPAAVRTFTAEEKTFWAFQPVREPRPPRVSSANPIDGYLREKREDAHLPAAPEADRRTLIRRLTFDLTGLPPTMAEVERFVNDHSPNAWDQLIDRLLASPAYGEKWGRRWLDVARYADSNGMDENLAHANAWRYRDYVIRAFNADKPYDQFVKEQIAGDMLSGGTDAERADGLTATGFLIIGPKMLAEDDPMKMRMDIIDEQLDTLGQAFLGLTLGCARCHDHKFDPITAQDYYSLAGIFYSTKTMQNYGVVARWHERPLGSPEAAAKLADFERRLKKATDAVRKPERELRDKVKARLETERKQAATYSAAALELARDPKQKLEQVAEAKKFLPSVLKKWQALAAKWKDQPPPPDELSRIAADPKGPFQVASTLDGEVDATLAGELKKAREDLTAVEKGKPAVDEVMAVEDDKSQNLKVHLRGNHLTLGQEAPRRFPTILAGEAQSPLSKGSGRLEFAEWVASANNPLTARVMANRVWLGHFGTGLVRSPDNFGKLGERPTHPELLDFLATEFVKSGWSVKHLHRLIVKSESFRMSTRYDPVAFQADPDNRLYWHFNRRRLNAEEQRDGMLAVAEMLDRKLGGSLMTVPNRQYVRSTSSKSQEDYNQPRRSVYLPIVRSAVYDVLQANDFPDPSTPAGLRPTTTVPSQALFLLNSKLADQTSEAFAKSLLSLKTTDIGRIEEAYRRSLSRSATPAEVSRAAKYLKQSSGTGEAKAWQGFCRVLLSSAEFAFVE
ncbi:PSD1 and planctomycete cytochrome C domain-containing protein [Limnoglobus roseus]|nr:PSD1 and planctomycete cytochrome C domain-containing protein [Limnoglobus roseus]